MPPFFVKRKIKLSNCHYTSLDSYYIHRIVVLGCLLCLIFEVVLVYHNNILLYIVHWMIDYLTLHLTHRLVLQMFNQLCFCSRRVTVKKSTYVIRQQTNSNDFLIYKYYINDDIDRLNNRTKEWSHTEVCNKVLYFSKQSHLRWWLFLYQNALESMNDFVDAPTVVFGNWYSQVQRSKFCMWYLQFAASFFLRTFLTEE